MKNKELLHTATGYIGTLIFFAAVLITFDGRITLIQGVIVGTVGLSLIGGATVAEIKRAPEQYHDLMNLVHQARHGDKHDIKNAWSNFNGD